MTPDRAFPGRRRPGPLRTGSTATGSNAHGSAPPRPAPGALPQPIPGYPAPRAAESEAGPAAAGATPSGPATEPAAEPATATAAEPATEHAPEPAPAVRVEVVPSTPPRRRFRPRRPVTARGRRLVAAQLVVGCALLGSLGGLAVEAVRGTQYEASTDVLVRFWDVDGYLLTGNANPVTSLDVADAATLATSREVLAAAATELGDGTTATDLDSEVTVVPSSTSNAITITATATTSDGAAAIAEAVADSVVASVQDRITSSADSLGGSADGELTSTLQQRADVLTRTVRPLQVLSPGEPEQTAPTAKLPAALAVVGLAAGALLALGLLYARPVVGRTRDAQRLLSVPAVAAGTPAGDVETARVLDRLASGSTGGELLVVPLDAAGEDDAERVAAAANGRGDGAGRWRATPPAPLVALGRKDARVDAVVLLVRLGSPHRDVVEAADLLAGWHPVDAVVVPAAAR